jgi:hypothetical protein
VKKGDVLDAIVHDIFHRVQKRSATLFDQTDHGTHEFTVRVVIGSGTYQYTICMYPSRADRYLDKYSKCTGVVSADARWRHDCEWRDSGAMRCCSAYAANFACV